ncbi:cubilin-like [Acropora muricata]|uniref:cubilin-like n=1 Tax=Acropora muricata TaxID=159855 RepID=UPI0034E4AC7D
MKGTFHSPNYPNKHSDVEYCSWKISVIPGNRIRLTFSNPSFHKKNDESNLIVYDGKNVSGEVLGVFYGNLPPPGKELYSSSNHMLVTFVSNATDSYTGFNASYSFIESRGKMCKGTFSTPAPTISTTKQRPSVIFVSNATDSYTGFNDSYSFIESRGAPRALLHFTLSNARRFYSSTGNLSDGKGLKERIKLARLNAVNWTDNIWCKMHQVNIEVANFYSSVLKLLIPFPFSFFSTTKQRPYVIFVLNATDSYTGFNASYSFIERRATSAPIISTTKQRPGVISSTYTKKQWSTNEDLNEETGKNKQKRQSDEEGVNVVAIVVPLSGLVLVTLSLAGVFLCCRRRLKKSKGEIGNSRHTIHCSNVTANVITSPSEDANELYAEIEEREYQEIPVRETYPEQQNENPLYESAAYETVPSI